MLKKYFLIIIFIIILLYLLILPNINDKENFESLLIKNFNHPLLYNNTTSNTTTSNNTVNSNNNNNNTTNNTTTSNTTFVDNNTFDNSLSFNLDQKILDDNKLDMQKCSVNCCGLNQWTPLNDPNYGKISQDLNNDYGQWIYDNYSHYVGSNFSCNNGDKGNGCICLSKNILNYMSNHGGNL
jgi:hypothetical protein